MMSLKEHEHKFWHYSLGALSSERQAIMGFSILWIMFFHSSCDCSNFPVIAIIKQFGNLGVDIFLLLSGIGLYYSADSLYSSGGAKYILKNTIEIVRVNIIMERNGIHFG